MMIYFPSLIIPVIPFTNIGIDADETHDNHLNRIMIKDLFPY